MSEAPLVCVVRTGRANLASVLAGLRRAGATPCVTDESLEVERARAVVLPGVGAFGPVMREIEERGIAETLRARIDQGRPTLAICLGLQLLCDASEESPGARGLGLIPCSVRRFGKNVLVPQLGWNHVRTQPGSQLLEEGYAYFANSYCLREIPDGWIGAWSDHGGRFVAAIERGAVLACQFHPELSGSFGAALLSRWLEVARERAAC